MNSLSDCFTLRNGYKIPCVALGTWQTPDGDTAIRAIKAAVGAGYRHIDAAAVYANEKGVGEGIRRCDTKREELFITSKVWNTERGYDKTMRAFDKTLEDLQLDYLDLYLIHWPASQKVNGDNWRQINQESWSALEKLYEDGRVKSIGVSNFYVHHLQPLMDEAKVIPMVNQIEYNPGFKQKEQVEFCQKNDILVEAWSPLGEKRMLSNEVLKGIAGNYNKSAAQICIKWCLQNGVLPLPKSITPYRIQENSKIFDFTISAEDMATINALPVFGTSGLDPDTFDP